MVVLTTKQLSFIPTTAIYYGGYKTTICGDVVLTHDVIISTKALLFQPKFELHLLIASVAIFMKLNMCFSNVS